MELFLHSSQQLTVIEIDGDTRPTDVATNVAPADSPVFLEDQDVPLAEHLALVEQGVEDGAHVFVGKLHKVRVTVNYNGPKTEGFSPSARVKTVFDWACGKKGFNLNAVDKAEHTLAVCGADAPADFRKHVGEYANEQGEACFDLAPKHRFEG